MKLTISQKGLKFIQNERREKLIEETRLQQLFSMKKLEKLALRRKHKNTKSYLVSPLRKKRQMTFDALESVGSTVYKIGSRKGSSNTSLLNLRQTSDFGKKKGKVRPKEAKNGKTKASRMFFPEIKNKDFSRKATVMASPEPIEEPKFRRRAIFSQNMSNFSNVKIKNPEKLTKSHRRTKSMKSKIDYYKVFKETLGTFHPSSRFLKSKLLDVVEAAKLKRKLTKIDKDVREGIIKEKKKLKQKRRAGRFYSSFEPAENTSNERRGAIGMPPTQFMPLGGLLGNKATKSMRNVARPGLASRREKFTKNLGKMDLGNLLLEATFDMDKAKIVERGDDGDDPETPRNPSIVEESKILNVGFDKKDMELLKLAKSEEIFSKNAKKTHRFKDYNNQIRSIENMKKLEEEHTKQQRKYQKRMGKLREILDNRNNDKSKRMEYAILKRSVRRLNQQFNQGLERIFSSRKVKKAAQSLSRIQDEKEISVPNFENSIRHSKAESVKTKQRKGKMRLFSQDYKSSTLNLGVSHKAVILDDTIVIGSNVSLKQKEGGRRGMGLTKRGSFVLSTPANRFAGHGVGRLKGSGFGGYV